MKDNKLEIKKFRETIEKSYTCDDTFPYGSFGEIICYELHSQPVNPRMGMPTSSGYSTGLTFKELAQKWGINVSFLGELILDHCKKL